MFQSYTPADVTQANTLLTLMTDPVAYKAKFDELMAATAAAQAAIAESKTAAADLIVKRADYVASLQEANVEHQAQIVRDRAAFDVECQNRRAEIEVVFEKIRAIALREQRVST